MLAPNRFIEITQDHLGLPRDPVPLNEERNVYVPTVALSEGNLCDWIAGASVGHCIQYHEGLLLRDRSETSSTHPAKERARIHAVARRAWIACELGLVHLFSQRVGEDHYRYLAVRSSSKLRPPEIRAQLRSAQIAPMHRKPH